MPERNYNQNCALARAADLLGERWTLLVLRELLISPRRFGELEARLKGVGTNLLAKRLRDMAKAGLVEGGEVRSPYRLSRMGQGLEPFVLSLIHWSLTWLNAEPLNDGLHLSDWDLLALKALFVPSAGFRGELVGRFETNGWVGWVEVDRFNCSVGLGEPARVPDILFPCSVAALKDKDQVLGGMVPSMRRRATRLLDCFSLPGKFVDS